MRDVMYRGECSGERRVREAVLLRRWKVASAMKCVEGEEGSEGLGGGWSSGVGIVRERRERACPRWGREGRVELWVRRVRVVL